MRARCLPIRAVTVGCSAIGCRRRVATGGRPKALIHATGETLLRAICGCCEMWALTKWWWSRGIIVTMWRQCWRPQARSSPIFVTEVTQPDASHSQPASLRLAIKGFTVQSDATLVLPVDMPLLTRADIVAVIGALSTHRRQLSLLAPTSTDARVTVLFSNWIAARIAGGEGDLAVGLGATPRDWVLEWQTDNLTMWQN